MRHNQIVLIGSRGNYQAFVAERTIAGPCGEGETREEALCELKIKLLQELKDMFHHVIQIVPKEVNNEEEIGEEDTQEICISS